MILSVSCNRFLLVLMCSCVLYLFPVHSLNPPHRNFQAMKDFLRSTGDIAGFLSSFRRFFKSSTAS
jgi:hypothetical protein